MLNLTANAIKFTPRGGRVTVRATTETGADVLILAISDNGTGMTPEDLTIAVRPFGQVRPPVSVVGGREPGVGLGLPIVRRLAELMGGTLDIASRRGIGTVVTVRLPLRPAA